MIVAVECQGDSMPRVSDARLATALVVWEARQVGQHRIKFSYFQCSRWLVRRAGYWFPPPLTVAAASVPDLGDPATYAGGPEPLCSAPASERSDSGIVASRTAGAGCRVPHGHPATVERLAADYVARFG